MELLEERTGLRIQEVRFALGGQLVPAVTNPYESQVQQEVRVALSRRRSGHLVPITEELEQLLFTDRLFAERSEELVERLFVLPNAPRKRPDSGLALRFGSFAAAGAGRRLSGGFDGPKSW